MMMNNEPNKKYPPIEKWYADIINKFKSPEIKEKLKNIKISTKNKGPKIVFVGASGHGKTSIFSWLVGMDMGVSDIQQGALPPKSYEIEVIPGFPKWTFIDAGGFGGRKTDQKATKSMERLTLNADMVLIVQKIDSRDSEFNVDKIKRLITIASKKTGREIPVLLVTTCCDKLNGVDRDCLQMDWDKMKQENENGTLDNKTKKAFQIISNFLKEREKDYKVKRFLLNEVIPVACKIPADENWKKSQENTSAFFWNMEYLKEKMASYASQIGRLQLWRLFYEDKKNETKVLDIIQDAFYNDAKMLVGRKTGEDAAAVFIKIGHEYILDLVGIWTEEYLSAKARNTIFHNLRKPMAKRLKKVKITYDVISHWWREDERIERREPITITEKFLKSSITECLYIFRQEFVKYAEENGYKYFPSLLDEGYKEKEDKGQAEEEYEGYEEDEDEE